MKATEVQRVKVEVPGFTRTIEFGPGERVCTECEGRLLSYATHGQVFGGSDADGRYIIVCHSCLGGLQQQCPHCKGWMVQRVLCHCSGRRAEQKRLEVQRDAARFDQATHLTIEEAEAAGIECVYWPNEGGDIITRLASVMDDAEERVLFNWDYDRPMFVWATTETELTMDAGSIIEDACEDLHDEALYSIGTEGPVELQAIVDAWCAKYGDGCTTYHPDYTRAILLPPIPREGDEEE